MELFGVTGECGRSRVTMVGDSVSDMQAAAAAGVTRVLVATGRGLHSSTSQLNLAVSDTKYTLDTP